MTTAGLTPLQTLLARTSAALRAAGGHTSALRVVDMAVGAVDPVPEVAVAVVKAAALVARDLALAAFDEAPAPSNARRRWRVTADAMSICLAALRGRLDEELVEAIEYAASHEDRPRDALDVRDFG